MLQSILRVFPPRRVSSFLSEFRRQDYLLKHYISWWPAITAILCVCLLFCYAGITWHWRAGCCAGDGVGSRADAPSGEALDRGSMQVAAVPKRPSVDISQVLFQWQAAVLDPGKHGIARPSAFSVVINGRRGFPFTAVVSFWMVWVVLRMCLHCIPDV